MGTLQQLLTELLETGPYFTIRRLVTDQQGLLYGRVVRTDFAVSREVPHSVAIAN